MKLRKILKTTNFHIYYERMQKILQMIPFHFFQIAVQANNNRKLFQEKNVYNVHFSIQK